jgi:hypothetical protein
MLVKLQWLSVEQRAAQKVLLYCFLKVVINNKFNSSFKEFLTKNNEIHNHFTRSANQFHVEIQNTTSIQKSLFVNGIKLYNELPDYLKIMTDTKKFKRDCVEFIKNKFPYEKCS